MFFTYTHMLTLLVMQLKFSECLEYSAYSARMQASYTVMWLVFQILLSLPICVSQLLIGQYGKRLQIRTWEMQPIISGIGFTMLLMSLLYMTVESNLSIMAIEYTIASFTNKLPWCDCQFKDVQDNTCIYLPGRSLFFERELKEIDAYEVTSNKTFYSRNERRNSEDLVRKSRQRRADGPEVSSYNYFKIREEEMRHQYIWLRIIIILLFWAAVFGAGIMKFPLYVKIAPCALVIMAVLLITGYVFIFLQYNVPWGIDYLSTMDTEYFLNIRMKIEQHTSFRRNQRASKIFWFWCHAAFTTTKSLIAGTGCMIFFGYFLPGNARPDINAALILLLKIFMCFVMSLFFVNIFQYQEARYGVYDMEERKIIAGTHQFTYSAPLLLEFLCHLPMSNICSIICFILLAIFQFIVVVLEMNIVITCLYESFETVRPYRLHLLGSVCILMLVIEFMKLAHNGIEVLEMIHFVKRESTDIVVMFYTFFIHILYGPNRLENDMEMMIQAKMPSFWIAFWIFSFVLALITIPYLDITLSEQSKLITPHYIILIIMILPTLIVAIILYFRYLKNHVLFNFIRPTEKWKPKDYEKVGFNIYDFRKKVRYKIPHKVCEHPCIDNAAKLQDEEREMVSKREQLLKEKEEKTDTPPEEP